MVEVLALRLGRTKDVGPACCEYSTIDLAGRVANISQSMDVLFNSRRERNDLCATLTLDVDRCPVAVAHAPCLAHDCRLSTSKGPGFIGFPSGEVTVFFDTPQQRRPATA